MEEKRKEELTKFFTVSSVVLSVLYAACILLSLLAPLLPKFIPLLAFFLFFIQKTLIRLLPVFLQAEGSGVCKGEEVLRPWEVLQFRLLIMFRFSEQLQNIPEQPPELPR